MDDRYVRLKEVCKILIRESLEKKIKPIWEMGNNPPRIYASFPNCNVGLDTVLKLGKSPAEKQSIVLRSRQGERLFEIVQEHGLLIYPLEDPHSQLGNNFYTLSFGYD